MTPVGSASLMTVRSAKSEPVLVKVSWYWRVSPGTATALPDRLVTVLEIVLKVGVKRSIWVVMTPG